MDTDDCPFCGCAREISVLDCKVHKNWDEYIACSDKRIEAVCATVLKRS